MFPYFAKFDDNGREIPNPIPVAVKIPFSRPEPLHLRMRRMILQAQAEQTEPFESFQDADDFDIPDDEFDAKSTPYEHDFDHLSPDFTPPSETSDPASQETPPPVQGEGAEAPPQKGGVSDAKKPSEPSV